MSFSFDTIKDFDKHIELSIPNYKHISELIVSMGSYFIKPDTNVYDLGCSTGVLLNKLSFSQDTNNVKYIGYDKSINLKPTSRASNHNICWIEADLNNPESSPLEKASLVLSVFTLQFLSISDRWDLVSRVSKSLNKGGAFIVCEKIYVQDGFMQDLFTFSYYDYKRKNFSEKEILDKQKDLRLIMTPMTDSQNRTMFRDCGFQNIEVFFSSLLFKGWVLVK
jgi:tRNA (cmo5U34)-methyltransferase